MATPPLFRLPAGIEIDTSAGRLDVSYDGDVEIEHDLGHPIGTIRAGGDLTIKLPRVAGELVAGGTLRIQCPVDGGSLHGREVVLGRQPVVCTAISAEERITIGAASLTVDVIIAPEIVLDPKASGRVTIIESGNERGPTKIKGGFSLADFEDTFGQSAQFLSQRGVRPLPGRDPVTDNAAEDKTAEMAPDRVELLRAAAHDELHRRIEDSLRRIDACYGDDDAPPGLARLRHLVSARDVGALREGLDGVWNLVLRFHLEEGLQPHHQVTHAFRILHGIVHDAL